jgi:phosphoglycerol geranylgeranyltransferase
MSRLADIVRTVDDIAAVARVGSRSVFSLDTNPVPAEWTHVTKIDPEVGKDLPLLFPLYLQHTSAAEVGGSSDVTGENTEETLDLVADRPATVFQEPSDGRHVTTGTREKAAFLAIPEVVNGDAEAMVGTLGKGIEYVKSELGPELIERKLPLPLGFFEGRLADFAASWLLREAVFESYIIMNLGSAAAREGNVTEENLLEPAQARQRAMAVEHYLESEIIYLEYSGRFGGEEAADLLDAISGAVSWPRVWYGGGLDNRENAQAMLDAGADAVVVGDIFHRVAAEERDHCEAAAADLDPNVDGAAVEAWVDEHVDIPGSSAAAFLSTVPDLPDPEARAREYVAATVETYLGLRSVAAAFEAPADTGEIERALDDHGAVPGAKHVRRVLDGGTFHRRLVVSLLADAADLPTDLPVAHLGVDL